MYHIEDEIAKLRRKCIGCGKCSNVCPVLEINDGLDPKEVMLNGEGDLSLCAHCGSCSMVCRRTDPHTVIKDMVCLANDMHIADVYKQTGYISPDLGHPSRNELSIDWNGDDIAVMPGCIVACQTPFLEYAASVAIKAIGKTCKELENNGCCLLHPMFREITEFERSSIKREMASNAGNSRIIALCGGCTYGMSLANVSADHITQLLFENLDSIPVTDRPLKVALQPGCSGKPLAKQLESIVTKMGHQLTGNDYGCCGKNSPLSEEMMQMRFEECEGADVLVVACPKCWLKYNEHKDCPVPVLHISELVMMATGDTSTLKYHRLGLQ